VYSASQIIKKNTRIRLRIIGTRVDATEIVSHFEPLHGLFLKFPTVCDWDNKGRLLGSHRLEFNGRSFGVVVNALLSYLF